MLILKNKTQAEIPTPRAGYSSIFPNADDSNLLYKKNPDGTFEKIGSSSPSSSTIPLSNTCYVNTDLLDDVASSRIFKNIDTATAWIIANGTPSAINLWQIILPAGNTGDITISNKYIRLVGNGNTTIDNLYSDIDFSAGEFKLFSIDNININNISIAAGKFISCFNCLIYNIEAAVEDTAYFYAENSFIVGGNFQYIECGYNYWQKNYYISFIKEIENLHGIFNYCTFKCLDYENKITFLAIQEQINQLNHCIIDEVLLNKDFEESVEIQLNKCTIDTISIINNITFNLFNSSCYDVSFDDETEATLNLVSSDIVAISGSGNIITSGYSFYNILVGSINFSDLNSYETSGNFVKIIFENAIPLNNFSDGIYLKITEAFSTYSGGYIGLSITNIQQTHTSNFPNEANKLLDITNNKTITSSRDIELTVNLNGENSKDWITGNINVYASIKTNPLHNV